MKRLIFIITHAFLLITFNSYGQGFNNENLLKSYGSSRLDIILKEERELEENHWFKYNGDMEFILVPTVRVKNEQHFSFNQEILNFINFEKIDTTSLVLVLNNNVPIAQIEKSELATSDYLLSPPIFKAQKRFKKMKSKINLKKAFVFRLPFLEYEWWILQDNCLYIFHKGRLREAERFIHQNYKEREFKALIDP